MSALGVSLFKQVKQSPGLYRFLKPLAGKYANLAGYRAHGLKYDDILIEENATVQKVHLSISQSVFVSPRHARVAAWRSSRE